MATPLGLRPSLPIPGRLRPKSDTPGAPRDDRKDRALLSKLPLSSGVVAAAKSLQSCPTLSDPMDCSLPGSSAHGIFQARVLEWGAIAFSIWGGRFPHSVSSPSFCRGEPSPFWTGLCQPASWSGSQGMSLPLGSVSPPPSHTPLCLALLGRPRQRE